MPVPEGMDVEWAKGHLKQFIGQTADPPGGTVRFFNNTELLYVVEQILDEVMPGWRKNVPTNDWAQKFSSHRTQAIRALVDLEHGALISEKLGRAAPKLSASSLHPWIWDGAKSLWQTGHRREAVRAASVAVNAHAQSKVDTHKLSEKKLFEVLFGADRKPKLDMPRLIFPDDDGGTTSDDMRRGARTFAEGCYAALRNPGSHDLQEELPEHEALEQLAAFSILARWVDQCEVRKTAEGA